ncbi:STAS/SEC14 domain-containing protein, partial [Thioclava sp. BHET1]
EDGTARRAVGIITAEDYRDTLIPLVAAKQKTHDKLKCLIVLDEDYATYSGDAVWSDTKFGLTHATTFTRVALVTDILWMKRTARLFMALMPFAFEAFPLSDLEKAKDWIRH